MVSIFKKTGKKIIKILKKEFKKKKEKYLKKKRILKFEENKKIKLTAVNFSTSCCKRSNINSS
jgi:hypothetical protein